MPIGYRTNKNKILDVSVGIIADSRVSTARAIWTPAETDATETTTTRTPWSVREIQEPDGHGHHPADRRRTDPPRMRQPMRALQRVAFVLLLAWPLGRTASGQAAQELRGAACAGHRTGRCQCAVPVDRQTLPNSASHDIVNESNQEVGS